MCNTALEGQAVRLPRPGSPSLAAALPGCGGHSLKRHPGEWKEVVSYFTRRMRELSYDGKLASWPWAAEVANNRYRSKSFARI
jgi:hypothetical protein